MALNDYRTDLETCCRCSACKFIPLEKVKGFQHVNVCPSITHHQFHAYSGGGRLSFGLALLDNCIDYNDKVIEVIYNCQMCGACDISCKYAMDMDVLNPLYEIRKECVNTGHTLPVLDQMIASLRQGGPFLLKKNVHLDAWFEGLTICDATREKVDVIYHPGCRTVYDPEMWGIARSNLAMLEKAGILVGILPEAPCCGGRAYQMGYEADALNQAQHNMDIILQSGAKALVTGCADCYSTFKNIYDEFGLKNDLVVYHIVEYLENLLAENRLTPQKNLSIKVTYHDPCHLGRLGEPYIHWEGKEIPGHIRLFDPPREFQRGTYGIYEPPRKLLRSLPGVQLVDMDRIREYAWCCGAGGGVQESNPDFALWTAVERIREAESTGAQALVTACPGCEKILRTAAGKTASHLVIFDISEIMQQVFL